MGHLASYYFLPKPTAKKHGLKEDTKPHHHHRVRRRGAAGQVQISRLDAEHGTGSDPLSKTHSCRRRQPRQDEPMPDRVPQHIHQGTQIAQSQV